MPHPSATRRWLLACVLLLPAQALGASWMPTRAPTVGVYNRAVDALNTGRLTRAQALFQEVLDVEEECGAARWALLEIALRQGDTATAVAGVEPLIELHPTHPDAWSAAASVAFATQDFAAMEGHLERLFALDPEHRTGWSQQASLDLRLGREEELLARLETSPLSAADQACLGAMARNEMGQTERARAALAACQEGGDDDLQARAVAWLDQPDSAASARVRGADGSAVRIEAAARFRAGDYARAAELLEKQLQQSPESADLSVMLAQTRIAQERWDKALLALEGVIDARSWIDVERSGARSGVLSARAAENLEEVLKRAAALLAVVMIRLERLDDAEEVIRKTEGRWGPIPELAIPRSTIAFLEQREDDAWADLAGALRAEPSNDFIASWVSRLASERTPDATIQQLLAASDDLVVRYNLAVSLSNNQDYSGCLTQLEPALERVEGEMRAPWRRLAWQCAALAGAFDLAATLVDEFIATEPDVALRHSWALQDAGRHAEAEQIAVRIESRDPETLRLRQRLLLDSYLELERLDEAIEAARGAPQELRYHLAQVLTDAGRGGDALPMLRSICPRVDTAERENCRAWLAEAQRLVAEE